MIRECEGECRSECEEAPGEPLFIINFDIYTSDINSSKCQRSIPTVSDELNSSVEQMAAVSPRGRATSSTADSNPVRSLVCRFENIEEP